MAVDTSEAYKKGSGHGETLIATLQLFQVLCSILNSSDMLDKLLRVLKPGNPHLSSTGANSVLLSMLA